MQVTWIKYILIYIASSYSSPCISQEINGQVKNGETGELIQYVNIGIEGKDIGTLSAADGAFNLDLSKAVDRDTLTFSFVGYESLKFSINEIRKNGLPDYILLREDRILLDEVIVASKRLKSKTLGIRKADCYPLPIYKKATSNLPFPQPNYRHEIGTFFANNQPLFLDSLEFNFTDIQMDTITFKVNIYINTGDAFKNILNEPIYISFLKMEESQRIDVSSLGLQFDSDFLISIENHERIQDNSLNILANFKSKGERYPTFYRRNTQSNWEILKSKSQDFGISVVAFVRQ